MKTAEWVSPQHPDKLCDRVSDAILDALLEQDPYSRVAVETAGGHGKLFITGEVTTQANVDYRAIAERITGLTDITVHIAEQSREIAGGVDTGGAGDQGIMVGFATTETDTLLPKEAHLARTFGQALFAKYPFDAKTQVTIDDEALKTIVASVQNVAREDLAAFFEEELPGHKLVLHLNPAGDWNQGGFDADAGVTGRKLAVDNYGPQIPVGGGAFSGKDATKVDRSAAYMARKVAVDYISRGAEEALVKIAYAIGYDQPVMATVEINHETYDVRGEYDLRPLAIIEQLDLRRPQFERLATEGHFGTGNIWDK